MLGRLFRRWRAASDARAVARRPIPDDLWRRTLNRYPFLARRDPRDEAELRRLSSLFLDRKEFSAAGGLRLRNDMVVAVAAQACLPVLRLGLGGYAGFVGIVLHPDAVVARRERLDEHGVMHEWDEALSGEAVQGGPLMLSWRDVRSAGASAGTAYNVVIHEFAHVLDMADGVSDGVPLLGPHLNPAAWRRTLVTERAALGQQIESGDETVLDPYASEGDDEFFAVASEAFFVAPAALARVHPALYAMLSAFYQQDPATETLPRGRAAARPPRQADL